MPQDADRPFRADLPVGAIGPRGAKVRRGAVLLHGAGRGGLRGDACPGRSRACGPIRGKGAVDSPHSTCGRGPRSHKLT